MRRTFQSSFDSMLAITLLLVLGAFLESAQFYRGPPPTAPTVTAVHAP